MSEIRRRFGAALADLSLEPGRALVAVSGGPDSLVLLDLLVPEAPRFGLELIVGHFDHGIAPESARVAASVAVVAARYQLAAVHGTGALGPGASETAARRARLAWFRAEADRLSASYLVTGHHADDQIETLLMRFLAGSGPAGLAGIAGRQGRFVRPLLGFTRAELAGHLGEIGGHPWLDPANGDPRHLRGWLRSLVLPVLETRLPTLRKNLLAARAVSEENRSAWESLTQELPGLDFHRGVDGVSVAAVSLAGYSSKVERSLLRALGRQAGLTLGSRQVDRVQVLLRKGDTGQRVDLTGGAVAELAFGRLRLVRVVAPGWDQPALGAESGSVAIGGWRVEWRQDLAPAHLPRGGSVSWFDGWQGIRVRSWRAGDRIRPLRGRGERLVVRCMHDSEVARTLRPSWPVLERDGRIVWVPGVCRGGDSVPAPDTPATRIEVRAS